LEGWYQTSPKGEVVAKQPEGGCSPDFAFPDGTGFRGQDPGSIHRNAIVQPEPLWQLGQPQLPQVLIVLFLGLAYRAFGFYQLFIDRGKVNFRFWLCCTRITGDV